ncbi:MAG: class I SAM-dependent methyltransferase, partial [Actinomycetota bacterium]
TTNKTQAEVSAAENLARIFESSLDPVTARLESFPKYARRVHLKRFLALYELFKLVLPVKGSIVECGVYRGAGTMSWAKLSSILEPENYTRRVYGFDTFEGFPSINEADNGRDRTLEVGELRSDCKTELEALIGEFDRDRYLGHIPKVELIAGDASITIPEFVERNPHLLVSLLFLDFDIYEPTKVAIEQFVPRMPKGSIIAFDELDNPLYPGETRALMETLGIGNLELQRLEWDPYIAFARIP